MYFSDGPRFYQFVYFRVYCRIPLGVKGSPILLYRFDFWIHRETMYHGCWVNARYVMVSPCEVILVFPKELNQLCLEMLAQELPNFESLPGLIRAK